VVDQPTSGVPAALSEQRRRLYEIDLLRFIAALMVVLLHYTFSGFLNGRSQVDFTQTLGPVTKYGYLGVDLFFLISGFVVFMSSWGRSASQFLISRVARLYPAYWVCLTVTTLTVVAGWTRGRPDVSLWQYLVNLTMFQAPVDVPHVEAVYWTLWAEWRFYMLLFIFALIGITVRRTLMFMWGWLAASAALIFLPFPAESVAALVLQPLYAHYFIAGMALHLVYRQGWSVQLGLPISLCWLLGIHQAIERSQVLEREESTFYSPIVVAVAVTVIFAVMMLVASDALARFGRPTFAALGALTYPLYLVHATAGYALLNWLTPGVNRWLILVGAVAAVCLVAWVISSQVERRAHPLLRRGLTASWQRARASLPVGS
jgi:peptidoglycan/LPS O-acetylase OafA/YrhL